MSKATPNEVTVRQIKSLCGTCVVVDGTRYKNILLMGHDASIFTTDVAEGWIEVVPKRALRRRLI